jgi:hypothetical protein
MSAPFDPHAAYPGAPPWAKVGSSRPTPRWAEDDKGAMKPVISRVHTIPVEDRPSLLHCAQLTCWCSPRVDPDDEQIILHQALTPAKSGWVLIGEL